MKIFYLNNDGGGFADHVDIAEGTTVGAFFAERVPHGKAQGLPDPRQSPAGGRRPGVAGGRSGEFHAHQNPRSAGVSLHSSPRGPAGCANKRAGGSSSFSLCN